MLATTLCEDSEATASDKGTFGTAAPCPPLAARCRKAGGCAGHSGSREYRRDPECFQQERWKTPQRSSPINAMGSRVRHCVECPKCLTRYLPAYSPYQNGSYLMPMAKGFADEWTLYCACGRPPISSRWSWSDLKLYVVSHRAHERGYGQPEEIVPIDRKSRFSG